MGLEIIVKKGKHEVEIRNFNNYGGVEVKLHDDGFLVISDMCYNLQKTIEITESTVIDIEKEIRDRLKK